MSDLVERVARAIYEEDDPWHKAWPWPDLQSDQAGVDQYRRIAQAAIAAMQTDAAPALKPAVEVAKTAAKETRVSLFGAAAVIEADRAAIITAKDAEIAALQAHADALAEYAVHQPDCRIGQPDCLGEEGLCTCGLSNALRAYEESRR